MPPPAPEKMVVTSVCLEDVHPEAGPLFYLPGSHKIPPYRFSNGTIRAIDAEMDECHAYLDQAITERGLKRETFLGARAMCSSGRARSRMAARRSTTPSARARAWSRTTGAPTTWRATSWTRKRRLLSSPRTTSRSPRSPRGSGLRIAPGSRRAGPGGW